MLENGKIAHTNANRNLQSISMVLDDNHLRKRATLANLGKYRKTGPVAAWVVPWES
jgi:hypothetical protein